MRWPTRTLPSIAAWAPSASNLSPSGANVLTHCNAGALATVDYGTALGVVRAAHEAGRGIHVFVDETRPFLQGARLTAWELQQLGVPMTLITDSMAGHFMSRGKVDLVVVGADRIAANGDVANKIGTYSRRGAGARKRHPVLRRGADLDDRPLAGERRRDPDRGALVARGHRSPGVARSRPRASAPRIRPST